MEIPFPNVGNGNETLLFPGINGIGNGNGSVELIIFCIVIVHKCDEFHNRFVQILHKHVDTLLQCDNCVDKYHQHVHPHECDLLHLQAVLVLVPCTVTCFGKEDIYPHNLDLDMTIIIMMTAVQNFV